MDTGGVRSSSDVLKLLLNDPEGKAECGCCYKVPLEVITMTIQELVLIHAMMGTMQTILEKGPLKDDGKGLGSLYAHLSSEEQLKNCLKNGRFLLTTIIAHTYKAMGDEIKDREMKFSKEDSDKVLADLEKIFFKYKGVNDNGRKDQEDKG